MADRHRVRQLRQVRRGRRLRCVSASLFCLVPRCVGLHCLSVFPTSSPLRVGNQLILLETRGDAGGAALASFLGRKTNNYFFFIFFQVKPLLLLCSTSLRDCCDIVIEGRWCGRCPHASSVLTVRGEDPAMSRRRPNFSTRTAQEDVARLDPNESENAAPAERAGLLHWPPTLWSRHQGVTLTEPSEHHRHSVPANPFHGISEWWNKKTDHGEGQEDSVEAGLPTSGGPLRDNSVDRKDKLGHRHRSLEEPKKLGTFSGVFVPTSLNVLSILMFLRFGFILGQAGLLGILGDYSSELWLNAGQMANQSAIGLLALSYLINLVTTMSLSAIATNGTVRGGGAYYLISRSLGPEFGGSIGVVFYLGLVFNTGMNAVGLVDCFTQNFGTKSGTLSHFLQEGFWWQYLWGTVILVLCTAICLAGSSIFARASNGLLVLLLIATFSIPLSAILMKPFNSPAEHVEFTGLSWQTLKDNLTPRLTKGAAGSQLKGRENFQDLFGILFPATGGIFA